MSVQIPSYLQLDVPATADSAAVITAPHVRFTVLTPRLLRLEYSPTNQFEDRPSQAFWYRQQPVPKFDITQTAELVVIETDALKLTYRVSEAGFTADTLQINGDGFTWHYGEQNSGNLLGTYRTLDDISGNTPLEQGILSTDGWVVVDDSKALVFNQNSWLEPRQAAEGTVDLYFFGHGRDYQGALNDYTNLTGRVPMFPRYVLGNWWSRYWAYTQEELRSLMREFKQRKIPLSVCIIDMDWHITDTPYHSGWTGYTWNKELFPDPQEFIQWLHEQGLRTAMNLHPAEGVAPHEAQYEAMAKRLGIDPASEQIIDFDIADPKYANAYLEELHHPHEADGVDFWWMDWQQGEVSGLRGLDPLWWLNHLHFLDSGRDGQRRPFIFSRWGGLGNHRYPIGFSGDTHVDWPSLEFQPYFTSTAANVRYGWWSHDIGGHCMGIEDAELYARWVQYGVFSPIFRLHSTNNPFHDRRPWGFNAETERVSVAAMRLRQALIPYLYSMMWRDHTENIALIQPMYHLYPELEEAYVCPQQYTFGSELIAAPYVKPAEPALGLSRQVVWLPEGDWYDFTTGQYYFGGRWQTIYGKLSHIPIFAKAGAIVPLAAEQPWSETGNPAVFEVRLFAGDDNQLTLYEDDGMTVDYLQNEYATTKLEQAWYEQSLDITINPAQGDLTHLPETRTWRLEIFGITSPSELTVTIDGEAQNVSFAYEMEREMVKLTEINAAVTQTIQIHLATEQETLLSHRDRQHETLWQMIDSFHLETQTKRMLAEQLDALLQDPETVLNRYTLTLTDTHKRALMEVITEAGAYHIDYLQDEHVVVMWNYRPDFSPTYQFATHTDAFWDRERLGAERGSVPVFKTLRCPKQSHSERDRSGVQHPVHWAFTLHYGNAAAITYKG